MKNWIFFCWQVASVLLENEASVTATTKKGFTPLHLASKYGNIKVTKLLLQKQAPVDAQGKVCIFIILLKRKMMLIIQVMSTTKNLVYFFYTF